MSPRQRRTQLMLVLLLGAVVAVGATTPAVATLGVTAATPRGGLQLSNAADPGVLLTGTNAGSLAASIPTPCGAAASRYRLDVVDVVPTDPADGPSTVAWRSVTLIGPATAGLPGPLDLTTPTSWQQLADGAGLALVPGTYTLALRCTDSTGTQVMDEFIGDTVTFTTATSWRVDDVVAAGTPAPAPPPTEPSLPAPQATTGTADRSTTLTVTSAAPTAGVPVMLLGRVVDPAVDPLAGMCEFLDGTAILATAPLAPDGSCTISRSFAAGSYSLAVRIVPADPAVEPSSSPAVTVVVGAAEQAVDPQSVAVEVPAGQILITTPYTPENPLALGDAVLAFDGSSFSASARFDRVRVVDSRAGNPGWTASVDRNDLTSASGGVIPALRTGFENVTAVYLPGNAIQTVAVNDVPANALSADAEPFAVAAPGAGTGTVEVLGDLVLEGVATSTPPGLYTTTVVFTVG